MTVMDLPWILARCKEDGDCVLWRLGTKDNGRPVYKPLLPDGRRPSIQVARVMWELTRGPIAPGLCVTFTCGNPRCLHHLEAVTKGEIISRMWRRPDNKARRTSAVTKTARQRGKLDMEKARYIRASRSTLKEIAQELGICWQLASRVRRGEAWKEPNPYAQLMGTRSPA